MRGAELTGELLQLALDEGFDRAGVAALTPVERFPRFASWIDRGDHAEMDYLTRRPESREDPRLLLPGARSALCVALQYEPLDGAPEVSGDLWPKVARYARGDDYHDIMMKGLRRIGAAIESRVPGSTTRSYVDTGPLLERELAVRAGLGAFGKNTLLLHPEGGSWFLIGEVLTTLDLLPSVEISDLCGSCTRCLDACPTGALPEPFRLDSRRCIAYWTIEHRGAVAEGFERSLEGWVFGCDVCQEVCPWNADPAAADHPELELGSRRAGLRLVDLVAMSRDEYVERFRGSPMKRAKLSGLKRNALLALANRGTAADWQAIRRALIEDPEPAVRCAAARAVALAEADEARGCLRQALAGEVDDEVRSELQAQIDAVERSRGSVGGAR